MRYLLYYKRNNNLAKLLYKVAILLLHKIFKANRTLVQFNMNNKKILKIKLVLQNKLIKNLKLLQNNKIRQRMLE